MKRKKTSFRLSINYPEPCGKKAMHHGVHFFEEETKLHSEPLLGLLFNLGANEMIIHTGMSRHILARNQFAMMYLPEGFDLSVAGKHNSFSMEFELCYLMKIVEAFPILDGLLENVKANIPTVLTMRHFVIAPKVLEEINGVVRNSYTGQAKEMYLDCKFETIIIHSLADLNKELPGFDDGEVEKIIKIYDFIKENGLTRHTVSMIADEFGIERRKLEIGFQSLYKTTVHHFITDERLIIARRLLRDTTDSISEIASAVGYTRKIFKKRFNRKFGYPPITLRNIIED